MTRPVGIDLGTTRSVVACVDENGRPRILSDSSGISLVPSVVLFDDAGVQVGDVARENAVAMPDRLVECVKQQMGNPNWRFSAAGNTYNAEEVSAFILLEMKRIAEEALGGLVTRAVVTVPAYFHDVERKATIRAAERAGLEVLKIVNEPTAAAISYGVDEDHDAGLLLVYDLGGGTFDITVMRRQSRNSLETLCTHGNSSLGGKNWDYRLVDYVAEQFLQTHGVDPRRESASFQDLQLRCERAKIALSERIRTQVSVQFAGKSLQSEITRQKFDELTVDLLNLTESAVDRALKEAGLTIRDIGLALLVGGSSKMPMVQNMMQRKAPSVRMSKHPDYCVAEGAAIEAARNSVSVELYKADARRFLSSMEVKDRTAHGLGVLAMEGADFVNAVVIPKNSEIPCELSREDFTTAQDGQPTIVVHLVQGEEKDPLLCVPVASYEFSGIPKRPAGKSAIRVTYRYNESNVVEVTAIDVASGKKLEKTEMPLVDLMELRSQSKRETTSARKRRVALLMDSSGSMGSRMTEAKNACRQFINDTNFELVEIGLVQFGIQSRASVHHRISKDPNSLLSAIDKLSADGGTPMAEAISLGAEMVGSGSGEIEPYLVLFTDGQPNSESQALEEAEKAKAARVTIICIGIASADRRLLDSIASTPGQSQFLSSNNEMVSTFGNVARLVSGRALNPSGR